MSVYVIRYGDLLKIGYSSDLSKRVKAILWGIPGGTAELIGHMPGDQEVETHLHAVFAASHFSGEWFRETPELLEFCRVVLDHSPLPTSAPRVTGTRKDAAAKISVQTRATLRAYALERWPAENHAERVIRLSAELGWSPSRTREFYHGDKRAVLRAGEAERIGALFIAPELATEATTSTPTTSPTRPLEQESDR